MAKRSKESYSDRTLDLAAEIEEMEGSIAPPMRYTSTGIEERREHVLKFLSRHVPQTVMAKLLKVSRRTIADDVKYIKEQSEKRITSIKNNPQAADADIGLSALRLEGIAQTSLNDAELARTSQDKNNFLRTAITAINSRANLLTNTGIYPKAGEEIRVRHDIKATFEAKLGHDSPLAALDQPASRRKVLSAAEKILKLSAKKSRKSDDDNVIDVAAEVNDA